MSDHGRINKRFHEHEKVQKCSLAAIGLWTLGNAWTRCHRTSGNIPLEQAVELARGDEDLIRELVDVELWDRDGDHLRYHDYLDHNGDTKPRTLAGRLVGDHIPADHPSLVKEQLVAKAAELLEEGQEAAVVGAALKLWATKSNAPPSWLPHMISDALRATGDRDQAMRDAYKTGDISKLEQYGFVFTPPDVPKGMTVKAARTFMMEAKKNWILSIRQRRTS